MNLFDLFIKIGVKDEASSKISTISNKLGNGLKTAAKIGTAAVSVAAAGIAAFTKKAVENYAEYEQLIGGVDTLFKKSSKKVQEYAAEAYKTSGMSANDYMNTVTSFSASLLQSLGGDTKKAADYANQAVIDMSDNANKMGTSVDLIQNAYQGFAKQNYTMLDNLKLGYGGTKTEMERLVKDAAKLDTSINANSLSFGNIVKAIHAVQKNLDITGTTAKEASSTISGSISSMKAAWSNLVTGIADDNADFEQLINNFVESSSTALTNLIPRVEIALNGVSSLVDKLFPIVVNKIPDILDKSLPQITKSAVGIINTLATGLSNNSSMIVAAAISTIDTLIKTISSNLEKITKSAFNIIETLANGILQMLPDIIKLGLDLIVALANGLTKFLPKLIPTIVSVVSEIVDTLTSPEQLSMLINSAMALILALVTGLLNPDSMSKLMNAAITLIMNLVDYLLDSKNISKLIKSAISIVAALVKGIISARLELANAALTLISELKNKFINTDWGSLGRNVINGILSGLKSAWSGLWSWFSNGVSSLISGAKEKLGIHSPSRVFSEIGKNMVLGLGEGWANNINKVGKKINGTIDFSSKSSFSLKPQSVSPDKNTSGVQIVQNIYAQKQSAAELMQEARWQARMGVTAVV